MSSSSKDVSVTSPTDTKDIEPIKLPSEAEYYVLIRELSKIVTTKCLWKPASRFHFAEFVYNLTHGKPLYIGSRQEFWRIVKAEDRGLYNRLLAVQNIRAATVLLQ